MLRGSVVAVAAAAVTAAAVAVHAPAAPAAPAAGAHRVAALETSVLRAINGVRRAHHLVPLRASTSLARAASAHSRQMGARGFFAHESADGSVFWKRVRRYYPAAGRGYWAVGENLLWASPDIDAKGAVKLWMESPEHRENLLAPRWREIGLSALAVQAAPGAFRGLDVTIVAADFGVRR